jgi:hypothetical protein
VCIFYYGKNACSFPHTLRQIGLFGDNRSLRFSVRSFGCALFCFQEGNMSNNNGKIIKAIAIFLGVLGVIGSIAIMVLGAMSSRDLIGAVVTGIAGAVGSVLGAFVLYSFGELIEQVNSMSAKLSKIAIKLNSNSVVSNKASCVKPAAQQQET